MGYRPCTTEVLTLLWTNTGEVVRYAPLAWRGVNALSTADFPRPIDRRTNLPRAFPRLSRRWRSCVAWLLLLALSWPSLGPLPWLDTGSEAHAHPALSTSDFADADADAQHRHVPASDIPGSPAHPSDHDCFQCQVLKHLARCVPAPIAPATIPVAAGCSVEPRLPIAPSLVNDVAALPPVRAPPSLHTI